MKTTWKVLGITVAAGLLVYPAMKLYQYVAKRMVEGKEDGEVEHIIKPFRLKTHAKHTPHHRAAHNGHTKPNAA